VGLASTGVAVQPWAGIGGGTFGQAPGVIRWVKQERISNKPVKCSFWQTDEGVFSHSGNGVHAHKKYGFT